MFIFNKIIRCISPEYEILFHWSNKGAQSLIINQYCKNRLFRDEITCELCLTSNTSAPKRRREPFPPLALEKPSCQLPPRRNCSNSPSPSPVFTAAPGSESRCLTTVVLGRSIESPFEVRILWEIARVSSESFCFWPGSPFGSGNRAGHPWSSGLSRFAKTESGQTSVQEFESGGSKNRQVL